MENTKMYSKSFKFNVIYLNFLILLHELYQAFYRILIPATLFTMSLPLLKSESQFIGGIKSIESAIWGLSMVLVLVLLAFKFVDGTWLESNIFKTAFKFIKENRKKLILLLLVGLFHGFSELIVYLSQKDFIELVTNVLTSALFLSFLDFFILTSKEKFLDNVFEGSYTFNSNQPLHTLTPLDKYKISEITINKKYNSATLDTKGEIVFNIKGLLCPLKRQFVSLSDMKEKLLNTPYTNFLFKFHQAIQFFKAIAQGIKYKSLGHAREYYMANYDAMTRDQKAKYTLFLEIIVIVLFVLLKIWLDM